MPNVLPAPTDYTDLDFEALSRRLVALFRSVPSLAHIDVDTKAEGYRVLLDANAYVGDKFTYLINRLAREGYLPTATQRRNILALVKRLGYRATGAKAATTSLVWTLPTANALTVTVLANARIRPRDGTTDVRFRNLTALTIAPGDLTVTGTAEHSEARTDTFLSDDRPDQSFLLSHSPYVDDSLEIETAGGTWTQVRNFLSSTANDRHFTTSIDAQDRCTVRFGNGRNGVVPTGVITATYKTGGGLAGNLPAGVLTQTEGVAAVDSNGTPVRITVTNPEDAQDGDDRQSNGLIKLLAPEQTRVSASAVAREDYEIVARATTGVARALMLSRRQDVTVGFNEGFLYVVPSAGGTASTTLLNNVAARFGDEVWVASAQNPTMFPRGDRPKTVTFQLRVRSAHYKTVNVTTKVFPTAAYSTTTGLAALKANITSALTEFFAVMVDASTIDPTGETTGMVPNPRIDFGYYLKDSDGNPSALLAHSDITDAINDATGVLRIKAGGDGVLLNGAQDDVQLTLKEFPVLGTVVVIDARTGLAL